MKHTNLILIGNGKSTTGNKLLNEKYFQSSQILGDRIQIKEGNEFKIVIFPNFGVQDKTKTFRSAVNMGIYSQIYDISSDSNHFGIVMVVQFYNKESERFLDLANDFLEYFESTAIKSLLIVCIQIGNIQYSDNEFQDILFNSEGYKLLKENNGGTHLNFMLWDNFNPYDGQYDTFRSKLSKVTSYNEEMLMILHKKLFAE